MSRTVSDSSAADVVPIGGLVPLSKEGPAYIESGDHVYLKTGALVDGSSLPFTPSSGVPSISSIFGLVSFPVAGSWQGITKAPSGVYVAVSETGICYSDDGLVWTRAALSSDSFIGVAYGLGRFIAISSGAIYESANGVNWSRQSQVLSNAYGITFAQDRFVIVGSSRAYVSTNGRSWVATNHAISSLRSAAGNSNCFIGGLEGNNSKSIARSVDGYNWGVISLPIAYFAKVVFGNGVFVALAYGQSGSEYIWFSMDGATWTRSSAVASGVTFSDIAFGGGRFVAFSWTNSSVTSSVAYYSNDGVNWSQLGVAHSNYGFPRKITYVSGTGGGATFYATAPSARSFYTNNGGASWVENTVSTGSVLPDVTNLTCPPSSVHIAGAYGASVYVVTSAASSQPSQYSISSLSSYPVSRMSLLASSSRHFYVEAGGRKCGYNTNTIDSDSWTTVNAVFGRQVSCAATNDNGLVVALHNGSACAWVSTDAGASYEVAAIPIWADWADVVFGGATCVAVARNSDRCAVSVDGGNTWTLGTMPSSAVWTGITYGNGQFVAVASGGTVAATSSDGVTWVARTLPSSSNWISVAFGQNMFVAVSNTAGTTAASSPDGITWTARTLPSSGTWKKVIYGERFMAVANNAVASSANGTSWTTGGGLGVSADWSWLVYSSEAGSYAAGSSNTGVMITSSTAGSSWGTMDTALGSESNGAAVNIFGAVHIFTGTRTVPYARVMSLVGALPTNAGNPYAGPSSQTPSIAVSGNTIVSCVGYSDAATGSAGYRSYLITSTDNGLTWGLTYNPRSTISWVVRGSSHFYAYSNPSGAITRSADGVTWEEMTPPVAATHNGFFKDDAGAIYVVCANTDVLMKTTDGLSWQTIKLPTISNWQIGAYGNGKYVVLSNAGIAAISSDGVNWAMATIPVSADRWYAMSYTDKFIALCGANKQIGITSDDLSTVQNTYGTQNAVSQTAPFAADLYLRIK